MRRYVPRIAVAMLAFANGVACVAMLGGSSRHLLGIARGLLVLVALLVPSAICFSQALSLRRGLRQVSYSPLTFSLSLLLLAFGAIALCIMILNELHY